MNALKKLTFIAVFLTLAGAANPAAAEPKSWLFGWWPNKHWDHQDFKPYYENGRDQHNGQWKESAWTPEQWAAMRKGEPMSVIQGFYNADIIRDQRVEGGLPVLEVGPAFYLLGGEDKRRVTAMIDSVYNVTTARENGIFMLEDWKTGKTVGVYTAYGLQIQ